LNKSVITTIEIRKIDDVIKLYFTDLKKDIAAFIKTKANFQLFSI
jgi:hypothetical protein